jgi:hypothetical protein
MEEDVDQQLFALDGSEKRLILQNYMLNHLDSSQAFASKTAASVCLDRWNDITRKIVNQRLISLIDSYNRRWVKVIKFKRTGVLKRSEARGREISMDQSDLQARIFQRLIRCCCSCIAHKSSRETYKGSFDPGIDQAL